MSQPTYYLKKGDFYMNDREIQDIVRDDENKEDTPVLKKKPVVKVLMEKKEIIYASEAAGYCSDQC